MTNKEFAEYSQEFRAACDAAKLPYTARQASKWRQKTGKAWQVHLQNHRNGNGTDRSLSSVNGVHDENL